MLEAKEYAKIFADRIAKGAFLTTCDGQKADTMTIGWGSVGYMLGHPDGYGHGPSDPFDQRKPEPGQKLHHFRTG